MSCEPSWVERVAAGDFAAVPLPFCRRDPVHFAHLLDGYCFAGRAQKLADLAQARDREYRKTGAWRGSALELWAVLFFRHRASRFVGSDGEAAEDAGGGALCEAIQERLAALDGAERNAVTGALAAGPAFGPGARRTGTGADGTEAAQRDGPTAIPPGSGSRSAAPPCTRAVARRAPRCGPGLRRCIGPSAFLQRRR